MPNSLQQEGGMQSQKVKSKNRFYLDALNLYLDYQLSDLIHFLNFLTWRRYYFLYIYMTCWVFWTTFSCSITLPFSVLYHISALANHKSWSSGISIHHWNSALECQISGSLRPEKSVKVSQLGGPIESKGLN